MAEGERPSWATPGRVGRLLASHESGVLCDQVDLTSPAQLREDKSREVAAWEPIVLGDHHKASAGASLRPYQHRAIDSRDDLFDLVRISARRITRTDDGRSFDRDRR